MRERLRILATIGGLWALSAAAAEPSTAAPAWSATGADTCLKCHDADTKVPVQDIFVTPHGDRVDPKSPFAQAQCEACHGPGGDHAKRLKRGEERPWIFAFQPRKDGAAESDARCIACHDDRHRADWQGGAHERNGVSCVSCHDVHAKRDPMLEASTQAAVCTTCHTKQLAETRLRSSHPIRSGAIACSDCHAPHGARGGEAMLARETTNALCFDCHAEKRGPFLWEHAPATEDCATCHRPHGSNHPALLTRAAPLLCQSCHSAAGHPSVAHDASGLANGTPSAMLLGRSCMNCHSQVHGSNHPSGSKLNR